MNPTDVRKALAGRMFTEMATRLAHVEDDAKAFIEQASGTLMVEIGRRGGTNRAELDVLVSRVVASCFATLLCGDARPCKGALRDAADSAVHNALNGD
jgi:hypothetical protein